MPAFCVELMTVSISKQTSYKVIVIFPNTKCCLLRVNSFFSSFNVVEVILMSLEREIYVKIKVGSYF